MNPKKILLVELSSSHTEIIGPILTALESFQVDIVIPELGFNRLSKNIKFNLRFTIKSEKTGAQEVAHLIKSSNYDLILLNSSQGKSVRDLILRLMFDKTLLIGFHHNPLSLVKSFTQKIINLKIKKYVVLADFIKDYLVDQNFKSEKIGVFYTLSTTNSVLNFNHNNYIAIPGVLEQDRRDYLGLIDLVANCKNEISNYKFILLGNGLSHDGPKIIEKIQKLGLSEYFIFFNGYVSDTVMNEYLQKSKFVMPLLHPNNKYFDIYLKTKISGAYNLAYAYKIPLLMYEDFAVIKEFQGKSEFYTLKNFNKKVIQDAAIDLSAYAKFDHKVQQRSLIDFLFDTADR